MESIMYGNEIRIGGVNKFGYAVGKGAVCPACGASVGENANYCSKCGAPVRAVPELARAGHLSSAAPEDGLANAKGVHRAAHFKTADTAQTMPHTDKARQGMPLSDARQDSAETSRPETLELREEQISVATETPVSTGPNATFLAIDAALLALVSLVPWVGSYYTSQGGAVSIPKLAIEGFKLVSQSSQYSSYAYQFGMGSTYTNAVALVFIVALVAGIGWLAVAKELYDDVKSDLAGQPAAGNGARGVAVLAGLVQVLVWIGVAVVQSSLRTQYLDLSSLGSGVLQTTGWVWVALAAGIGADRLRKAATSMQKAS